MQAHLVLGEIAAGVSDLLRSQTANLRSQQANLSSQPTLSDLLRSQQGNLSSQQGNLSSQQTLSRLFEPARKNRRLQALAARSPIAAPWEHDFCCLSEPGQKTKPTQVELDELKRSGLGKKRVTGFTYTSSHADVVQKLYSAFPPLQFAGGFKFYKSNRVGELVEIPMPQEGYSVSFLRTESELNRAVAYIVPIQQHLEPVVSQGPVVDDERVTALRYYEIMLSKTPNW